MTDTLSNQPCFCTPRFSHGLDAGDEREQIRLAYSLVLHWQLIAA
jgi:hypothetical protein